MKTGMIKVSVMYPYEEGKSFDMDYYLNEHVPMVGGLLGDAVKGVNIEKGISGGAPNSHPVFTTIAVIYFDSLEDFQNSFSANADKIMGDLPNFTSIKPEIQISEVML